MDVLFDGDNQMPEFEISGTAEMLSNLGKRLTEITEYFFEEGGSKQCTYFPHTLRGLSFSLRNPGNGLLDVVLDNDTLKFIGNKVALDKLGNSLINFFDEDTKAKDHFHLDYYEGNMMLNPTNYSLIFMCNNQ